MKAGRYDRTPTRRRGEGERGGERDRRSGLGERPNRSLRASVKHAWSGLVFALKTERNMRIHFALTLLVLFVAVEVGATFTEMALLVLTISAVWVTELINTAIEAVVDLESPARHPLAKAAKDVAAAAVLVSAIAAIAVAYFVLFDKVWAILTGR